VIQARRLERAPDDLRGAGCHSDSAFRDASFDASTHGTIEHFDETETRVGEMARVLKPGGRAIIGVPNGHDPSCGRSSWPRCRSWGCTPTGRKSYSRRALRDCSSGPASRGRETIPLIPGWLRMLDLPACVSGAAVSPVRLSGRSSGSNATCRSSGNTATLATVVVKPERPVAYAHGRCHRQSPTASASGRVSVFPPASPRRWPAP